MQKTFRQNTSKGTTYGPLEIPYVSLLDLSDNPIREEDFTSDINNDPFEFIGPKDAENAVKNKMSDLQKEGATKCLFDGDMAKLVNYAYDGKNHKLKGSFQPTTFYRHKSTNLLLDEITGALWNTVKDKPYEDLDDGLSNAFGNGVVAVTNDNKLVIFERRDTIEQYPGLYGIASGFTDPKKDGYNPFKTIKRVITEQLGAKEDKITDIELTGIGRAADDRHIEGIWRAKIYMSSDELEIPAKSKHKNTMLIDFTPEALAPYLVKTIDNLYASQMKNGVPSGSVKRGDTWTDKSPAWVPAQAIAIISELKNRYGPDRVLSSINAAYKHTLQHQNKPINDLYFGNNEFAIFQPR